MLRRNKKALSEVVGTTLLIVMALALFALVTTFLMLYVPKETPECKPETSLIIKDATCLATSGEVNITLENKGLFKVDAAYVRFGKSSEKILTQINKDNFILYGAGDSPGLNPQETFPSSYYAELVDSPGQYRLEVQPVIIVEKQLVVCENALITQPLECK